MPSNKDVVQELQEILRSWEEVQSVSSNDPTSHLLRLCDLFERETENFLKQDPDPFDDRHPIISKPDCALGQILRALFKNHTFVTKLVNHYLRDTYFSGLGIHKSSNDLNTATCRLLLDLLYGLDIPEVFHDSETMVLRLYNWAEKGTEPLRTYAIGLLAAAMDIPDLATAFRDQNAQLVPIILKRLWELKDEVDLSATDEHETVQERPFAHLSNDMKAINGETSLKREFKQDTSVVESPSKRQKASDNQAIATAWAVDGNSGEVKEPVTTWAALGSPKVADAASMGFDSMLNSDCSNSSWAEMKLYIVGTFKMYPLDNKTKEMFMLKYLRPVGEYQEALGHVYEHKALELVFHYINLRYTTHAKLSFEALRFLGSLLFHKKFCIEFVNMGGIQKLLQVPRPSLPADGVALCLWYLAYCEEAIERTCLLPESVVKEMVRYALWLLECSHQSSRMHAVMFFGMAFRFRAILERFDEQDGLRKMLNILSTLSIFQANWDQDAPDEPNEVMMWQTVKQVCISIKNYFESHLAIKVHQLQRVSCAASTSTSCSAMSSFQHATPAYKAVNVTQEAVERNVEYLLEHLPFRSRWKAVEQFLSLRGLEIFLRLITNVVNESFSLNSRADSAVSALETLYVCSVAPGVQDALCDKLTVSAINVMAGFRGEDNDRVTQELSGYLILIECLPENLQTVCSTPELQKAALNVLVNCLCAPIYRPGSLTQGSTKKKALNMSEEIIKQSWDCVRNNNGIMYLLNLLNKKVPITDADCIRGLACRALDGLSRSDSARQIMSKLPIFTSGQLQLLMKEPILPDKRIEHVKFQRHALSLIKAMSERDRTQKHSSGITDVSIQGFYKANVVAQTKIRYNKKQLLQLISSYLHREGLEASANQLIKEASLPPLPVPMGPPRVNALATPTTQQIRSGGGSKRSLCSSSSRPPKFSVGTPSTPTGRNSATPGTPLQIKINRSSSRKQTLSSPGNESFTCEDDEMPFHRANWSSTVWPAGPAVGAAPVAESNVSLDGIVIEYLANQHALCKNPVVTCPTFDLLQPHRCPEPRSTRVSAGNFVVRQWRQEYAFGTRGCRGVRALNRKFLYSRFRNSHVFRPSNDDEIFVTCEFTPDEQNLLVGTTRGELLIYNKYSDTVVTQESVHQGPVTSLVQHASGDLILTSCSENRESALWSIKDNNFDSKYVLNHCNHAEFTNSNDKILGTMDQTARIYDMNAGRIITEFTPQLSNQYKVNKAALHPSDDLLLTDGVLFDIRSGKELHKFDKINPILNGIFHVNGLEIVSSSEIWDLRTFHLLKTVPSLALCDVSFNNGGDIMFGIMIGDENVEENAFETSFKTIDAADYSSIATIDVRRIVSSLAVNASDTQISVVETDGPSMDNLVDSAAIRIYDVGMVRQEEDEALDDDDDDDLGSDEESDDSEQDDDDDDEDEEERNSNAEEDDDGEGDGSSDIDFISVSIDGFSSYDSYTDIDSEEEQPPPRRRRGRQARINRRRRRRRQDENDNTEQNEEEAVASGSD